MFKEIKEVKEITKTQKENVILDLTELEKMCEDIWNKMVKEAQV